MSTSAESSILVSPIFTHSLSLLLGVISSYFVWWLISHKWIPSINFGPEICRYKVDGENGLYVCAFENAGHRDIVDVEVVTRVGVERFNEAEGWLFFSLKTNSTQIPVLEPNRRALVRIFDQREERRYIDAPPPSLRKTVDDCVALEEIFDISNGAIIQLHVFGYDSFSGTRRHYVSPDYSKHDVRSGRLKGLTVVEARTIS
ncbi:hypothetical protein [uncultured Tateyamaria sp.]|uniref:hypothetical protein n=1 Tax=uncultured Tateyamaria sp. TaxID=455651 RepID=UPI00263281F5|nr:hypothetical protein [uncultured Tateyamaria sp.]